MRSIAENEERSAHWGTNKVLPSKLASINKRPMGFADGIRSSVKSKGHTKSGIQTTKAYPGFREKQSSGHGARKFKSKKGNITSTRQDRKFSQSNVPSAKSRWFLETRYQSVITQSVCSISPLQDGGDTSSKGTTQKERLDGETGPKRCLPFGTNVQSTPEISPIRVASAKYGNSTAYRSASAVLHIPSPSC